MCCITYRIHVVCGTGITVAKNTICILHIHCFAYTILHVQSIFKHFVPTQHVAYAEIQIGLEQTVYSMNEGETVEVCTVILGPDQIATGLVAYANLSAVPDTADGEIEIVFFNLMYILCTCSTLC